MKLSEILTEGRSSKKLVVVYGGRFQPFHKGHFECYKWLCKKFGAENVWIATSDKTNMKTGSGDLSPFTYKEKREIMVSLYDIDPRRVIKCKNPAFKPSEVFEMYKGIPLVYVTAVGKKDVERYRDSDYFKPLPNGFSEKYLEDLETLLDGKGAYYVVVPMQTKELSGTVVRNELLAASDDEKEGLFKKFFGKYDRVVDELISAKFKGLQ